MWPLHIKIFYHVPLTVFPLVMEDSTQAKHFMIFFLGIFEFSSSLSLYCEAIIKYNKVE